jgi:hypothetical protein
MLKADMLIIVMLKVVMLIVAVLIVAMLIVDMLSFVMLSVVLLSFTSSVDYPSESCSTRASTCPAYINRLDSFPHTNLFL